MARTRDPKKAHCSQGRLECDEKESWAERLCHPDGEVERSEVDGLDEGAEEGALLKLDLLQGNEEGWAERLCFPDGEVEGSLDGSDEGPEEGSLLTLGLLELCGGECQQSWTSA